MAIGRVKTKIKIYKEVIKEMLKTIIIDANIILKLLIVRLILLRDILIKQLKLPITKTKKYLPKKKNQRRLLILGGVILILGLMFLVVCQFINTRNITTTVNNQTALINKQEKTVKALSELTQRVQAELKQKDLTIKKNVTSVAQKQAKIDELQKKLEASVLGYGSKGTTGPVYANTLSTNNGYAWGNCTAGVASWIKVPLNLGNAGEWGANASAQGYKVDMSPTVNSVAYTTEGWAGHVALVVGVGSGTVDIQEMNYGGGLGVITYRTVTKTAFTGYIHFS